MNDGPDNKMFGLLMTIGMVLLTLGCLALKGHP